MHHLQTTTSNNEPDVSSLHIIGTQIYNTKTPPAAPESQVGFSLYQRNDVPVKRPRASPSSLIHKTSIATPACIISAIATQKLKKKLGTDEKSIKNEKKHARRRRRGRRRRGRRRRLREHVNIPCGRTRWHSRAETTKATPRRTPPPTGQPYRGQPWLQTPPLKSLTPDLALLLSLTLSRARFCVP